ncbi:leukocyte surface antigen CD47 isoform X6 [Ammospiza nelsoni]|uniref:leukocyte surface antigen CD47 isoform X6 n=1 Tax=Ammospiza nelsoni TaxID=2857394 RepID=UPI0028698C30|nr:leukocyte surface antigen CD47 isoform X6 [Ammospiza nelsoni]
MGWGGGGGAGLSVKAAPPPAPAARPISGSSAHPPPLLRPPARPLRPRSSRRCSGPRHRRRSAMWLLAASVLLGALHAGSAQLTLSGTSIIEKNDCNRTVVLPCYATNLIQNSEKFMFVTWTSQGVTIFSYHGGTKNINRHPSFSSARLLSPSELIKGVASLAISSRQAVVGNYSCKVTESNREGKIRMQLVNSSVDSCDDETSEECGSWFLLMEKAVIISLVCFLVILCAAQLTFIGLKYEIEPQRKVCTIVALVIFAVLVGVGAALFMQDGYTVQNQAGLGLLVIPAVILVPLQYVMFGIVFDSLLQATLALIGLKLLGFIIAIVGFALCVSACPPLHGSVLIAGSAIMAIASLLSLAYVLIMGSRMKDHPRPGNRRAM